MQWAANRFADDLFFWNELSILFLLDLLSWLHLPYFMIILSQKISWQWWEAWFGPGLRICLPIHRQRSGMFAAQCFWVPLSIVFLASRPKRWHSSGATSPWKWDTLILPKPFIEDRDDRVPPLFVWLWLEGSWNCTRQMVVKIRLGVFWIYLLFSPSQHSRVAILHRFDSVLPPFPTRF